MPLIVVVAQVVVSVMVPVIPVISTVSPALGEYVGMNRLMTFDPSTVLLSHCELSIKGVIVWVVRVRVTVPLHRG